MRSEDEAEQARQAKLRADAKLEARLRALGLLDPDDDLVAAICAPRAVLIACAAAGRAGIAGPAVAGAAFVGYREVWLR